MSWELALALTVLALLGLVVGLLCGSALAFMITRVPYIPTPRRVVRQMVEAAELQGHEHVVDLGCGDGRLLIEAKRHHPTITAVGYEVSPIPYLLACTKNTVARRPFQVFFQSFFAVPLSDADVLFLYQLPHMMVKLEEKFTRELRPGTRVISHGFQFPGRRPSAVHHIGRKPTIFGFAHPSRTPTLYVYHW